VDLNVKKPIRWGLLLAFALLLGSQANRIWPRDNEIVILLPKKPVHKVQLSLFDSDDDLIRSASFFPGFSAPSKISYGVSVPSGTYRLEIEYEISSEKASIGKSPGVDWTRMGVQHQVRLEGEEYRFPPPEEAR
jgi:hypothetical protein